jgi:hypothetical protein
MLSRLEGEDLGNANNYLWWMTLARRWRSGNEKLATEFTVLGDLMGDLEYVAGGR